MAATDTAGQCGRIAVYTDVAVLQVTVVLTAVTYSSAGGGAPFDLTTSLQPGIPNDLPYINPGDVVCMIPIGASTNGYLPMNFALGTPTYTADVGSGYASAAGLPAAGTSQGFLNQNTLATCPATIRLWGCHGNASTYPAQALIEAADGAVTDTFTALLFIARGGYNK